VLASLKATDLAMDWASARGRNSAMKWSVISLGLVMAA